MELKLNIYKTRLCREVEKTVSAHDFGLSTAVCEDVLNVINIDMLEGGIEALSTDSLLALAVPIVRDGFPFFRELLAEIFEVSEDEVKRTKIIDVAMVIVDIVKYSFEEFKPLATSVGKNSKN